MRLLNEKELCTLLETFEVVIAYTPFDKEIMWEEICDLETVVECVPREKDSDPNTFAEEMTKKYNGKTVALLIPGMRFDATGTRHGRGGGWYDRFLAKVPRSWLRIGLSTPECFYEATLIRSWWDEPMDVIMIQTPQQSVDQSV